MSKVKLNKQTFNIRRFNDEVFKGAARDILKNPDIKNARNYIQHGVITVYSHSIYVAIYSLVFARRLHIDVDERSLIRGALLHDFFLYDWHDDWNKLHGFTHPKVALENAKAQFNLNRKERNIIRSHMWPMTFLHFPAYKEAWIVCIADKFVSFLETFKFLRKNF